MNRTANYAFTSTACNDLSKTHRRAIPPDASINR